MPSHYHSPAYSSRLARRQLRAALAPDLPGTARMIAAARLKARAAIPLGVCFAIATAAAHGLAMLTAVLAVMRAHALI